MPTADLTVDRLAELGLIDVTPDDAAIAVEAEPAQPDGLTDDALALRFAEAHADDMRYCAAWGKWLRWDGTRWRQDETLEVFEAARAVVRAAATEHDAKPRLRTRLQSARTIAAVVNLARSDRRLATASDDWDRDPWLLATPTGTVDLRTGRLRPNDRADLITKTTAVGPDDTDCPRWLKFLDRIFAGDAELIGFIQRLFGYALTGSTREHVFAFFYGTGANGKGVLLNTWRAILGDYACVASTETFVAHHTDRHPTDLAMLRGARTVVAQETESNATWAEARIKSLTGGDPITARFMRQDFFTYVPTFKLFIAGNVKPNLRTVDEAMRRRLLLVPCTVTIPPAERDPHLTEKLRPEWPAILAWAVRGALEWQRSGLAPPATVREATAGYFGEEDAVGRFLAERTVKDPAGTAEFQALFAAWKEWATAANEYVGSAKRFAQNLETRGLPSRLDPRTRRRIFPGLALRSTA